MLTPQRWATDANGPVKNGRHEITLLGALLVVLSLSLPLPAQAPTSRPRRAVVDHTAFDRLLRAHVHQGLVDYLLLRRDHWQELEAYLNHLAKVRPAALDRNERLAFYLNLYNATLIQQVILRFRVDFSPSQEKFKIFKDKTVKLWNGTITLNELENEIIRKQWHEPRVHVALVCGALSCPPLLARAFLGRDLDQVLDQRMGHFLNDRVRNPIDPQARRLVLSQIFNWYARDFGGPQHINAYVSRYLTFSMQGWPLDFKPYSWKLNASRPANGRWMQVTSKQLRLGSRTLPRGSVLSLLRQEPKRALVRIPFKPGKQAWVPGSALSPW